MDISLWAASSTKSISGDGTLGTNKLLGDMVFSKIDLPVYSSAPFLYNTVKDLPEQITENVATSADGFVYQSLTRFASVSSGLTPSPTTSKIIYTSFASNEDGAKILDDSNVEASAGSYIALSGFYDAGDQDTGNKLTLTTELTASMSVTRPYAATGTPFITWSLKGQVYRVPYDNNVNTYGPPVVFGTLQNFLVSADYTYYHTGSGTTSSGTYNIEVTKDIDLLGNDDINANDKFYVDVTLTLVGGGTDFSSGSVTIAKKSSATRGILFSFNGDRILPKVITTYDANSIISGTTAKLVRRASSTSTARPFWNTSAGKPAVLVSKNLNPTGRKNTIRYGGNYVAGTKINNLSSFFGLDSADVPVENGEIVSLQRASRLQGNGTMLLALCQNESAYILLGEQELTQGNNQGILSISSNVIGTIRNLGYNYGLQDKQSSFNYKGNIWWWDNYNKKVIKYNEQGIELVSDTFMRSHFLTKSGNARFAFDPFYNMCFVSIGDDTTSIGYSDTLKRWISTYAFKTDHAESYGDKMVLFKGGVVYKSLQSGYNSFLGATAVDSTIKFTLNSRLPVMPLNVSITHNMNVIEYSQPNGVKASLFSISITNENSQTSAINETNFIAEDNRLYAHILRDSSSTGGLIEGNYIIGYLNNFVVSLKDKTQNMRLNSLDIEVQPISGHS